MISYSKEAAAPRELWDTSTHRSYMTKAAQEWAALRITLGYLMSGVRIRRDLEIAPLRDAMLTIGGDDYRVYAVADSGESQCQCHCCHAPLERASQGQN